MAKMYIELNRTLHGWGDMYDVLEVDDDNQAANDLVTQELATRLAKADLARVVLPGPVSDAETVEPPAADAMHVLGQARSEASGAVQAPADIDAEPASEDPEPAAPAEPAEAEGDDGLEKMTIAQLMEKADTDGVDLTGANKKAEIIARFRTPPTPE